MRSTYYAPEGDVYKVVYATIDAMAAARTTSKDPETITIGNHYQSCMDEKGIAEKGVKPLEPVLQRIRSLKDKKEPALSKERRPRQTEQTKEQ